MLNPISLKLILKDQSSHPRLNRSTWDFSTLSHNEIPAVGIEFGSRVIIGGFVFRSLAKSQTGIVLPDPKNNGAQSFIKPFQ